MQKAEIIIEIAQSHDGSLGILHSYIDAIAETGVDTIKFQMHIPEAESSKHEPFRINFSYEDKTRYDYWKRMSFSKEQWIAIKKHCEDKKVEFLCSPFSIEAIEILEQLSVKRYKIASGEINNTLLLEAIAQTKKPVLLSSGMSNFLEIDTAINFFNERNIDISLFQCTTSYPTKPEEVGLNLITEMKKKYIVPIGLSDHSGEIYPSLAAVALGAQMIEVHAVFDKKMFGPDSTSSLTITQISDLVKGIRHIEKSLNHKIDKDDISKFETVKKIFGKSLAARRDLSKGQIVQIQDLESKKPAGYGIPPEQYESVVGKKIKRAIKKYDFINLTDLE